MGGRNPAWTRDELLLALDLYLRHNPAHISESHPEVARLSKVLNALRIHKAPPDPQRFRNPSAVYMKLCNFLRLDPEYAGKGLDAGSKLDKAVWDAFAHDGTRLRAIAGAIQAGAQVAAGADVSQDPGDDQGQQAPEGRILTRLHTVRERNPLLVKKKKHLVLKKTGLLQCEVCGFVFSNHYGTLGEGFIECHHTIPVSQLTPGEQTKLKDLALVCANCHRMLHRGGELLSIDGLRLMYQSAVGLG